MTPNRVEIDRRSAGWTGANSDIRLYLNGELVDSDVWNKPGAHWKILKEYGYTMKNDWSESRYGVVWAEIQRVL